MSKLTPRSCALPPVPFELLLRLNPGTIVETSWKSRRLSLATSAAVTALTTAGTSWMLSSRRRAVTMMSLSGDSACAAAGAAACGTGAVATVVGGAAGSTDDAVAGAAAVPACAITDAGMPSAMRLTPIKVFVESDLTIRSSPSAACTSSLLAMALRIA